MTNHLVFAPAVFPRFEVLQNALPNRQYQSLLSSTVSAYPVNLQMLCLAVTLSDNTEFKISGHATVSISASTR